jgi:peptide/nickel transport system substrate-binding protein
MTYWNTALSARISRRRAVAATGAGALGSGGSAGEAKSSLLTTAEDTSKTAKIGGTLKLSMQADIPSFEPNMAFTVFNEGPGSVHARLTELVPGQLKPTNRDIVGGIAESWEWSPDGLSLTLKLRQGVKFQPVAPVNGRVIDMDDVIFSWNRLKRVGTIRSEFANEVNPNAPITSFAATDARTLVIKLKEPLAYLLSLLAHVTALTMLPKETDTQFDPKRQVIGAGPFYQASYTPSVGLTMKRHPDFYRSKEYPFVDQVDLPIITEYAQGIAQLRAGGVYTYPVRADDVLSLKREAPQLNMYQTDVAVLGNQSIFGWQPAGKSPFSDERVRQAYSMLMDRDTLLDVARNVNKFKAEGLPVETRWNTSLQATYDGWWLDPKSNDFGPNAKYFKHDVAEAKKLMAAAGYASGVEIKSNHITSNEYGTDFVRLVEVLEGMEAEGGFRFRKNIVQYATEFIPKYRDALGNFEGMSYKSGPTPPAEDAVAHLSFFNYSKGGSGFYGFDAAGKGDNSGDPQVDALLLKARGEIDTNRRRALVHDVQRYLAGKQYNTRWAGGSSSFGLAWPAVRNYNAYRGDIPPNFFQRYWLDPDQAPFKK